MAEQATHFLLPEQLRVGIYVHLDLQWMDHPFTFSSFLIKTDAQVERIRDLGLTQIRYSPERSSATPLVLNEGAAASRPETVRTSPSAAIAVKRETLAALAERRRRIQAYEQEFLHAGQNLRTITRNVFSRPEDSRHDAEKLVTGLADSLLTDRDVTVNLMPEHIQGEESYHHALNVTVLSMMLARELGSNHEALLALGIGALFHDIGKHELPDRLLLKREALTSTELEAFREHVAHGVAIGKRLGLSRETLDVIAHHHETVDGSGYPEHLSGERLSLLAKIVAIANTYDNLCNLPNASRALSPHEALSLMYSQQRSRFEAGPMAAFIRCLGVYPPGTLLLLGQDVFGLVVSVNSTRPLRPIVQIHEPGMDAQQSILIDLEDLPELAITRTLRPSQLPRAAQLTLSPRKRFSYFFDTSSDPVISATPKDRTESRIS
jgi:putative nucleotidyltransferase with HDIG domain